MASAPKRYADESTKAGLFFSTGRERKHKNGVYTERPINNLSLAPLQKTDIEAKVVDFISEVSITQMYINTKSEPVDTTYILPVDDGATVSFFEAKLGDLSLIHI